MQFCPLHGSTTLTIREIVLPVGSAAILALPCVYKGTEANPVRSSNAREG